jgi:hypothetical protein
VYRDPHGEGIAYFLILDDQRRADLLNIIWMAI